MKVEGAGAQDDEAVVDGAEAEMVRRRWGIWR